MSARLALAAALAAAAGAAAGAAPAAPDPRVSARLDPRVELENVLERLAGPRPGEKPELFEDSPEAKAIDERFGRFRSHPSVSVHAAARGPSFPPDVRLHALFAVSDPPGLEPKRPLSFSPREPASVEDWLAALRRFARETDFAAFLRERERQVEPELEALRTLLREGDWLRKLEAYVGLPFEGRLVFELSPARTRGLHEPVMLADGTSEVTCLVRSRGEPRPIGSRDKEGAAKIVFHEAGHGILDTLALLHADEIPENEPGGTAFPDCDGGRLHCLEEHVVEAVMIRLFALEFGEAAAARLLREKSSPDLPKLAEMTRALRDYEADRARWPTLAAYFPRWIEPLGPARDRAAKPGELAAALGGTFRTPGQRKRAARWLEKELEGGVTPALAARRDALRSLK